MMTTTTIMGLVVVMIMMLMMTMLEQSLVGNPRGQAYKPGFRGKANTKYIKTIKIFLIKLFFSLLFFLID